MAATRGGGRTGPPLARDRAARNRRWSAAILAAAAVHAIVALGLILTPVATPPREPAAIDISLFAPVDPVQADAAPAPPKPSTQAPAIHRPPTLQPSSVEPSPVGPQSAPPASPPTAAAVDRQAEGGPRFSGAQPTLKLDCIDRGPAAGASGYGKEPCLTRRYTTPQGQGGAYAGRVDPAWEAAARSQQSKRQPLPAPQPQARGCPGGNLGLGCSDDALVFTTKKAF